MFFNLGPFHFGAARQPEPPRNGQGRGLVDGLSDFLQSGFMNPFVHPREEREEEAPRPTFSRKRSKKSPEKKEKKEEVVYSESTGMYWKHKANEQFKKGHYETALAHYNKAIELNNTDSIFFSNRARCLKKMGRMEQCLKDAQEAVELDVENIKAHLICGQALAEMGKQTHDVRKVQNSIRRLKKALTLCVGQNKSLEFQQEISTYIYRAKKLLWYMKLQELKQRRVSAINQYKNYITTDPNLTTQERENKLNEFIQASNDNIVFQIPDYLCCRITLDLMEDPVMTNTGIAYERSAIEEHIAKNGKTDPCSRKPISGTLYPCIPVRHAIEDFLEKNPWAYEYTEGEDYHDIAF